MTVGQTQQKAYGTLSQNDLHSFLSRPLSNVNSGAWPAYVFLLTTRSEQTAVNTLFYICVAAFLSSRLKFKEFCQKGKLEKNRAILGMIGETCSFFDWVIFFVVCVERQYATWVRRKQKTTKRYEFNNCDHEIDCLPCEPLPCCKNQLVRQNMYNKQFYKNLLVQATTTTPCKATKPTIKKDKIVFAYLSKKKKRKKNKQTITRLM